MILLDTHIWIWFADESDQLTQHHRQVIEHRRADGLGVRDLLGTGIQYLTLGEKLE